MLNNIRIIKQLHCTDFLFVDCESHDGTVSVKNFRHLEVVRAVILETMRMRSVEIGLPRELAEDLEVGE